MINLKNMLMGLLVLATLISVPEAQLLKTSAEWATHTSGVRNIRVTTADSTVLMEPNGRELFYNTVCDIETTLVPISGGFDLLVSVINRTGEQQLRPVIRLSGVHLSRDMTYLDARNLGQLIEEDATGSSGFWSPRLKYPNDLYSPVMMVMDSAKAFGTALVYDIFTQHHPIQTFWGAEGGQYTGTNLLDFELSRKSAPFTDDDYMQPGDSLFYTVQARFADPAGWQATLEPYRQYFQNRFGGVRYIADLRPMHGEITAMTRFIDDSTNPRGYLTKLRPDLHGWKPVVDSFISDVVANNYKRIMCWTPSGMYQIGKNYPPEFMSEILDTMVATMDEWDRLRDEGVSIGMWWGRSAEVSGGWNSGELHHLNPDNPDDSAFAYNELNLAVEYGIDEIGLDAFNNTPLWYRYRWLQQLQDDFPSLRFITEPADCDIMHTIAPTFVLLNKQMAPGALADWLNPGHETLVQLQYYECTTDTFEQLREWGQVPLSMSWPVWHEPDTVAVDTTGDTTSVILPPAAEPALFMQGTAWYTLGGRKLPYGPVRPGVYVRIEGGVVRKVLVPRMIIDK